MLSFTGATSGLIDFVAAAQLNCWVFHVAMLTASFALCKFIDQVALMLIVVPVYAPLVTQLGFDPIWFWMMFLVTIPFGGITPPFGYTMFVFKAAAPEVPMGDVYRAGVPVLTVALLAVILMTFFPAIVTWVPARY